MKNNLKYIKKPGRSLWTQTPWWVLKKPENHPTLVETCEGTKTIETCITYNPPLTHPLLHFEVYLRDISSCNANTIVEMGRKQTNMACLKSSNPNLIFSQDNYLGKLTLIVLWTWSTSWECKLCMEPWHFAHQITVELSSSSTDVLIIYQWGKKYPMNLQLKISPTYQFPSPVLRSQ